MRHGHVARSLRNMRSMPMPSPPYTRSLHNSQRAGAHACGPSMVKFHATSRGHKWWSGTQPAFGGECGAVHSPVVACTHMPRSTFLASVGAIAVLPQPTFLGASERCQRDAREISKKNPRAAQILRPCPSCPCLPSWACPCPACRLFPSSFPCPCLAWTLLYLACHL